MGSAEPIFVKRSSTTAVFDSPANAFSVSKAENFFDIHTLEPDLSAITTFVEAQMDTGCLYKKGTLEFGTLEKVLVFRLACELNIPCLLKTEQTIKELITAERVILDVIWNDKPIINNWFYSLGLNRGTSLQLVIPLGPEYKILVEKLVDESSFDDFKQVRIHKCVELFSKGKLTYSTPMGDLIVRYPELAVKVLDKFQRMTPQDNDVKVGQLVKSKCSVEVSFDIVNDFAILYSRDKELNFKSPFDEIGFLKDDLPISRTGSKIYDRLQNHSLWLISVSDNVLLLNHPIVRLFVLHMWDRVRWSVYYQFFYVLVYLISLECFVLGDSAFAMANNAIIINDTEIIVENFPFSPVLIVLPLFVKVFLATTISLCVIGVGTLLYRLARFPRTHSLETIIEAASYFCIFIYGVNICTTVPDLALYNWDSFVMVLGTIGVCLSWTTFMMHCRVLPHIGWQIEVFLSIFTRFLKYMPVGVLLVCGFGSSFAILLRNVPMFNSVHTTLIVAAQMVFSQVTTKDVLDSAGGYSSEIHSENIWYMLTVYFFIFGFFVLAILTFVNMLTGLANADVQKMLQQAEIKLYRRKLEMCLEFANYYQGNNNKKDGRWLIGMDLKLFSLCKKLPWGNSEKTFNESISKVVESMVKAK